jgi:hypothetical protein
MASEVGPLQPAYAELHNGGATGYSVGSVVAANGVVAVFDGDGFLVLESTPATSGTLLTGFHRLGTLDPKSFQYLRVKTEGSVGSISVKAVLPDGSTTATIGTVTAGTSKDIDLASHVQGGQEYIGLLFTFSGDGTSGPVLLGYQLKALPLPKRQRILKWPLLVTDTYQDRYSVTRGGRDGAWETWSRLEELEESNALVSFTDHRTGETGNAYIEQLELQMDTPSKGASTGFGGIGYATLRKVS